MPVSQCSKEKTLKYMFANSQSCENYNNIILNTIILNTIMLNTIILKTSATTPPVHPPCSMVACPLMSLSRQGFHLIQFERGEGTNPMINPREG